MTYRAREISPSYPLFIQRRRREISLIEFILPCEKKDKKHTTLLQCSCSVESRCFNVTVVLA